MFNLVFWQKRVLYIWVDLQGCRFINVESNMKFLVTSVSLTLGSISKCLFFIKENKLGKLLILDAPRNQFCRDELTLIGGAGAWCLWSGSPYWRPLDKVRWTERLLLCSAPTWRQAVAEAELPGAAPFTATSMYYLGGESSRYIVTPISP